MRTSARRQPPAPAEIIAYRFNDCVVYVPPAKSFHQAVIFARSAFDDLTGVDKSRISFSLNVQVNGKMTSVNIDHGAWPTITSHLVQYEIIDVHVQPEIRVSRPPEFSVS